MTSIPFSMRHIIYIYGRHYFKIDTSAQIYMVTISHQRDAGYDFAPLGFPGGEFLHANKRGDKTNRLHSSTSSVNSDCLNFHTYFINTFAKKLPFLSEREVLCYM